MAYWSSIRVKTPDDGGSHGTKITDAETGAEIRGVEEVVIRARGGDIVRAELRIGLAQFDGVATPKWIAFDPITGEDREIAAILWADGGRFSPGKG